MSFYNPYSKYPDVGQGVSDIVNQLMMMMMMNRMMGPQTNTQTSTAPQPMGGPSQVSGGTPQSMQQGVNPMYDPQMLMRLMAMLRGGM